MGGGGFLGLGPAPSAPAAPNYAAAAQQTAQGNLDAARQATAANRVNQVTPYGNLDYAITGADPYGNPTWTATQTLSPQQQQLLDYQNATSIGLGKIAGQGLGYVENMLNTPFNTSALPSTGFNPSQSYQDAYMQRLQPQIQQTREALQQQLANKGIDIGSTAYDRAMQSQGQRENDLLAAATTQGFGVGQQARQQALQEQAYLRNEPLNTLSAVRTGSQVTGPQFVNSAQQATTQGADLLGAAGMQYNAQMGDFNAKQAAQQNFNQGLMSLGGAAMMSDIRTKENIVPIGVLNNGLTLYSFEYKDEFKDHPLAGEGVQVGVMAQEVEQVYPYAVTTLNDGYKAVNYGLLP
jgi:Chaperone of endosialidase